MLALVDTAPWEDLTVGVAAILGLVYVARTMRQNSQDILKFLYNHLSTNTKAQEHVAEALGDLVAEVKLIRQDGQQAHVDSDRIHRDLASIQSDGGQ